MRNKLFRLKSEFTIGVLNAYGCADNPDCNAIKPFTKTIYGKLRYGDLKKNHSLYDAVPSYFRSTNFVEFVYKYFHTGIGYPVRALCPYGEKFTSSNGYFSINDDGKHILLNADNFAYYEECFEIVEVNPKSIKAEELIKDLNAEEFAKFLKGCD